MLSCILSSLVFLSLFVSQALAEDFSQMFTRGDGIFISVELDCLDVLPNATERCREMIPTYEGVIKALSAKLQKGMSAYGRSDIAFQVKLASNAPTSVFISCYTPHPGYGFKIQNQIRISEVQEKLLPTMEALLADARKVSLALNNPMARIETR